MNSRIYLSIYMHLRRLDMLSWGEEPTMIFARSLSHSFLVNNLLSKCFIKLFFCTKSLPIFSNSADISLLWASDESSKSFKCFFSFWNARTVKDVGNILVGDCLGEGARKYIDYYLLVDTFNNNIILILMIK